MPKTSQFREKLARFLISNLLISSALIKIPPICHEGNRTISTM
nr:MAG TPA: hypothetical protein [Caudoviricetes sp.]